MTKSLVTYCALYVKSKTCYCKVNYYKLQCSRCVVSKLCLLYDQFDVSLLVINIINLTHSRFLSLSSSSDTQVGCLFSICRSSWPFREVHPALGILRVPPIRVIMVLGIRQPLVTGASSQAFSNFISVYFSNQMQIDN